MRCHNQGLHQGARKGRPGLHLKEPLLVLCRQSTRTQRNRRNLRPQNRSLCWPVPCIRGHAGHPTPTTEERLPDFKALASKGLQTTTLGCHQRGLKPSLNEKESRHEMEGQDKFLDPYRNIQRDAFLEANLDVSRRCDGSVCIRTAL